MTTPSKLAAQLDAYIETVTQATLPALTIASMRGMGLTDQALVPVHAAEARLRTHAVVLEEAARWLADAWPSFDALRRQCASPEDIGRLEERYLALRAAVAALDA